MSWRPEGWENPYPDKPDDYNYDQEDDVRPAAHREICKGVYEAGADAMLEALREGGVTAEYYLNKDREVCSEPHTYLHIPCGEHSVRGTTVFIPEEEYVKVS